MTSCIIRQLKIMLDCDIDYDYVTSQHILYRDTRPVSGTRVHVVTCSCIYIYIVVLITG